MVGEAIVAAGTTTTLGGDGSVTTDTTLQPGEGTNDVVFDGTEAGFVLPSGGMRDRTGTTVVDATDVAIGKLEVNL